MCVDGPEDRGSIAKYGSPERMPVLSRKERTLPMRSLPAAFAVFRIPPPAESSACRQLIFDRRTPCGGCLSSFEGSSYISRTSPGVPTIAAPAPSFCPRSDVHQMTIPKPGYPEWENSVTFSRSLTKRRGSQRCETRLKTNNRRKGSLAFRIIIHSA